jgi:hypothetical protein
MREGKKEYEKREKEQVWKKKKGKKEFKKKKNNKQTDNIIIWRELSLCKYDMYS